MTALPAQLATVKDRIIAATRRICAAGVTSSNVSAIEDARALLVEHDHLVRAIADGERVPEEPETKVAEDEGNGS